VIDFESSELLDRKSYRYIKKKKEIRREVKRTVKDWLIVELLVVEIQGEW
jgi:hypothetical protein